MPDEVVEIVAPFSQKISVSGSELSTSVLSC